ncbi:pbs-4, partial [Pristionchus pacificus]
RMSNIHFLVGVATKDFVVLASDKAAFMYGAILVSENDDKEFILGKKLSMLCVGEDGDVAQFGDWTKRNLRLYSIRNGYELSPRSAHHWIRRAIADGLRSRDRYTVDTLVGGYDNHEGAFLGTVDYLGNGITDQPYLFRGFGGRFCYAMMDKAYKKDMQEAEVTELVRKCITENKKRFMANLSAYNVVIIDKNGRRSFDVTL